MSGRNEAYEGGEIKSGGRKVAIAWQREERRGSRSSLLGMGTFPLLASPHALRVPRIAELSRGVHSRWGGWEWQGPALGASELQARELRACSASLRWPMEHRHGEQQSRVLSQQALDEAPITPSVAGTSASQGISLWGGVWTWREGSGLPKLMAQPRSPSPLPALPFSKPPRKVCSEG